MQRGKIKKQVKTHTGLHTSIDSVSGEKWPWKMKYFGESKWDILLAYWWECNWFIIIDKYLKKKSK